MLYQSPGLGTELDMRHLKATVIMAAMLVLTAILGLVGCGDDHRDHMRSDRDRYPSHNEGHDNDHHEDRGGNTGHDQGEHGER
jgi:hypothetical protein